MKTRPRELAASATAAEDVLDDPLAGPVGRMGLAREDDLDRPLRVPQQPRQPLLVAEQERGPLVGREAAGEADGQDRPGRAPCSTLLERRRRLAVAGELVAQPAAREERQLQLLVQVGLPQLARRGRASGAPRTGARSVSSSRSSRSAPRSRR